MLRIILSFLIAFVVVVGCKNKQQQAANVQQDVVYTCSMHPQIIRHKPGKCPICGMDLIKKETTEAAVASSVNLSTLLKPTNEFVISSVPVTSVQKQAKQLHINAYGKVAYDTRTIGTISAWTEGRIEHLYVRYRFQEVKKGQKIMDIYSPELVTSQENLLFLLQNDPDNHSLITAAKQRLLLLGMSQQQLSQIIRSGKPSLTVSVYSNYTGHIHESGGMMPAENNTASIATTTQELQVKEGMYVKKGQPVFTLYHPDNAWILLSIYNDDLSWVHQGDDVKITAEAAPNESFHTTISYVEPFFREGEKTATARINFNNRKLMLPVGSQVTATIFSNTANTYWLPSSAVVSLGLDKVVFIKDKEGFKASKVQTGRTGENEIQILKGLSETDSVAVNAQFLIDSESFLKTNE